MFALLIAGPAAHADKRVALVIGNSAYRYTPELANPRNDAADMAAVLGKHGFEVIKGIDLDKAAFDRKVGELVVALKGADAGVFFYAGHGLQVAGRNYLVPIDAKAEEAALLDLEMVRADTVHAIMERQTETNVLFLDACRDNPLARNLARSMGTRSAEVERGLAEIKAGVGTLISFSTQPGNVALDGAGRNSSYTGALVKHLAASKDDLNAILIDVRNDVMRETRNRQVPWEHVALRARFYFSPPGTPAAPARPSEAAEAWAVAEHTGSVPALEAFIRRFGDTYYGDLAKVRLAELKQAAEAAKKKTDAERQRLALLETPPLVGFRSGATDAVDATLQNTALWRVIKREFPDWYAKRLDEAVTLARENKDDAVIGQHVARKLVELRRQQVANGLSAKLPLLKTVASAYLETLGKLRAHSVEACSGFVKQGEIEPTIVGLLQGSEHTAHLQALWTAVFEAIADGRQVPRVHPQPSQAQYATLASELTKRGWTQADFRILASKQAMAQAEPEKVCQLVYDFFDAQLALPDAEVHMRLLVDSLRPVFAG